MMIEIDDFYTDDWVIDAFQLLMEKTNEPIFLFALLGKSDRDILRSIKNPRITIGIHGWCHFCEPRFDYWAGRHLLETALSWDCFDRMFVMPWNKMPRLGFIKALRESNFTLVTPHKIQRVIATLLGCNSIDLKATLLHPPDLLDLERIEILK